MLLRVVILLLSSSLKFLTVAEVVLEQTSPSPVCSGDDLILTCTVTISGHQALLLIWLNPDNPEDRKIYLPNDTNIVEDEVVGVYTTEFVGNTNDTMISLAMVHKINFTAVAQAGISCLDNGGMNETFHINQSGTPSPPVNVTVSALSVTSVLLSWNTPPTSDTSCPPVTYTITIKIPSASKDPGMVNTSNTTTHQIVSDLTQGLEYTFTVAGVDAGGRAGEKSISSSIDMKTLQSVSTFNSAVLGANILLMWTPPPPSSRPPVTGYKISHNTTGGVLQVNQTSTTTFLVQGVAPGNYFFTVLAINVLGEGEKESIIVTVSPLLSTSLPTTKLKTGDQSSSESVITSSSLPIALPSESFAVFLKTSPSSSLRTESDSYIEYSITSDSLTSFSTNVIQPQSIWTCTCDIVYFVGIPVVAMLCSVELILVIVIAVGCMRKKRRRTRDGSGTHELVDIEPSYATPSFQTRRSQKMELQGNPSYGKTNIRHRQQT